MTNKEILQASLLDIIFENRNKEYGAYALRLEYDKRLVKALGIGLGVALLFIVLNFLKFNSSSAHRSDKKDEYNLSVVDLGQKPPEPEPPRRIEQPRPGQVANVAPIIVDDNNSNNRTQDQDILNNGEISTINTDGRPMGEPNTNTTPANSNGNGEKPTEPETPVIKIAYRAPQYPGGMEALVEFMRKNLVTPEEIEVGEKRIVKVKFIVGVDGSITDVTIVESPGKIYDKEVSRVIRKMPKWEPAIQNDMNVAVSYILPVTFISEEE